MVMLVAIEAPDVEAPSEILEEVAKTIASMGDKVIVDLVQAAALHKYQRTGEKDERQFNTDARCAFFMQQYGKDSWEELKALMARYTARHEVDQVTGGAWFNNGEGYPEPPEYHLECNCCQMTHVQPFQFNTTCKECGDTYYVCDKCAGKMHSDTRLLCEDCQKKLHGEDK